MRLALAPSEVGGEGSTLLGNDDCRSYRGHRWNDGREHQPANSVLELVHWPLDYAGTRCS